MLGNKEGDIQKSLKGAFSKIKEEMDANKRTISSLKKKIESMETGKSDSALMTRVAVLEKKLDEVLEMKDMLRNLSVKGKPIEPLKTKLISKFNKNRKSIIKQKIMDIVREKQYTISELKELVVDSHHYCSKASFYRYVEEMKGRKELGVIDVNNMQLLVIKGNN
ncbi:MAG: hypothetical protein GY861_08985 [bacterium]|nr:hypothetical protein [bacterium]